MDDGSRRSLGFYSSDGRGKALYSVPACGVGNQQVDVLELAHQFQVISHAALNSRDESGSDSRPRDAADRGAAASDIHDVSVTDLRWINLVEPVGDASVYDDLPLPWFEQDGGLRARSFNDSDSARAYGPPRHRRCQPGARVVGADNGEQSDIAAEGGGRCRGIRACSAGQPKSSGGGPLLIRAPRGQDEVVVNGEVADHADGCPAGGSSRVRFPSCSSQPVTSCWAVTLRPLTVTITPCSIPSV